MLEALLTAYKKPATGVPPVDLKTLMLIHFDGTNGSTSMPEENGIVTTANSCSLSTSQSKFGGAALNPGTGNLSFPGSSRLVLTDNFTIEGWAFRNGAFGDTTMFSCKTANTSTGQTSIGQQSDKGLGIFLTDGAGWKSLAPTSAFPLNQWNHWAVVKKAGVYKGYINGVGQQTLASALGFGLATGTWTIGGNQYNGASQFPGFLDEMRMVEQVLYDGDFTPPTAPFDHYDTLLDINAMDGTLADASHYTRSISSIGGAASVAGSGIALNGSSKYLTLTATQPDFILPGDFTLEMVVNPTARSVQYPALFSNYSTWGANGSMSIFAGHSAGDTTKYGVGFNGTFPVMQSQSSIAYGTPTRLALVRKAGSLSLYVNGVKEATYATTVKVVGTANAIWLGDSGDAISSSYFNGYIRKVRLIKGTALDPSQFLSLS
jgi:hypothetical protein